MKVIRLLLILLIFPIIAFSQNENAKKSFDLHIMPFALLDETPRLRIGFEYNTKNSLAYDIELGYGNSSLNKRWLENQVFGYDYQFIEIRPEIKYYMYESDYMDLYAAGELYFLTMKDILWNTFYVEDFYRQIDFKQARINKEKIGAHIKLGTRLKIRKLVSLDLYGGIGYAYINIDYFDVKNPIIQNEEFFEEMIPHFNRHKGASFDLHLTAGLKIGFVIRNT